MKNKKNVINAVALWIIFYIAIALIFKNSILYSYEEVCSFGIKDINVLNYNVTNSLYEPIADDSMLELEVSSDIGNCIKINFAEKLQNPTNITLYQKNHEGIMAVLNTQNEIIGKNKVELSFEQQYYTNLYIHVDQPFYLDNIEMKLKEFNLLQMNMNWIKSVLLAVGVSFVMAVICVALKKKRETLVGTFPVKVRDSNLELLRIICMFMIIIHHCVVYGGAVSMDYSVNKLVSYVFLPVGKICFVAFIAISMWFLVDQKFKASRFLKIWVQVFFYSVLFTTVAVCFGKGISVTEYLSSFLPIAGNSHGFAASYLLFYLLLPFIVRATKDLNKKQARYLLMWLFYAQVLSQIIGYISNYYQPIYSELTLFIFCYVLSLNLKKWPIQILGSRSFTGCIAFGIWILLIQIGYMGLWGRNNKVSDFISATNGSESSVLIIIAGYALFFFAKEIKVKNCSIINKVATYTFGILLIHDHNFFRTLVWSYWVETRTWYNSSNFISRLLVVACAIFFVGAIIDYLRRQFLEIPLTKSKAFGKITQKWDGLFVEEAERKNEE